MNAITFSFSMQYLDIESRCSRLSVCLSLSIYIYAAHLAIAAQNDILELPQALCVSIGQE